MSAFIERSHIDSQTWERESQLSQWHLSEQEQERQQFCRSLLGSLCCFLLLPAASAGKEQQPRLASGLAARLFHLRFLFPMAVSECCRCCIRALNRLFISLLPLSPVCISSPFAFVSTISISINSIIVFFFISSLCPKCVSSCPSFCPLHCLLQSLEYSFWQQFYLCTTKQHLLCSLSLSLLLYHCLPLSAVSFFPFFLFLFTNVYYKATTQVMIKRR